MPAQDTTPIKEKILSILRIKGPSLPVHIARELNMSILFSSAFLAELLSEKKIKISHMKVGSSPIYLIPGQEPCLEKFSQYIKGREKDALVLLQQKKFLKDTEQQPAIRVALRSIRDFAIPFKYNNEIFWRYFTIPESEFKVPKIPAKPVALQPLKKQIQLTAPKTSERNEPKPSSELNIFDKKSPKPQTKKPKPSKKPKTAKKQDNKFFNKTKEFLTKNSIELLDIEEFSKNQIILKIRDKGQEKLLIAHNKKRINEKDIIKAYKKAQELNLPYTIASLGEPLKKLSNLVDAVKSLSDIKKI